jgi:hypothetical protein
LLLFQGFFEVSRGYFAALVENFAEPLASHPCPQLSWHVPCRYYVPVRYPTFRV